VAQLDRAVGVERLVADRLVGGLAVGDRGHGGPHPERPQDPLLEQIVRPRAGDLLEDDADDLPPVVRVQEALPRRRRRRVPAQAPHHAGGGRRVLRAD
jgi:hypothetical protein